MIWVQNDFPIEITGFPEVVLLLVAPGKPCLQPSSAVRTARGEEGESDGEREREIKRERGERGRGVI